MSGQDNRDLTTMTADIVAAYAASRNHLSATDLPNLIQSIHQTLRGLGVAPAPAEAGPPVPAVPVKRAITDKGITCLACGKVFKSLKRHIGHDHGMSPAEYRAAYGLKSDFPMVHPDYSQARRQTALNMGLGRRGAGGGGSQVDATPDQDLEASAEAAPEPTPKPKRTRKPRHSVAPAQ
jgi:predicted transcriptional regulator